MKAVSGERDNDLWLAEAKRSLELLNETKQEQHIALLARPHHLERERTHGESRVRDRGGV